MIDLVKDGTSVVSRDFAIQLLCNLEDDIQTVIDASVPNKIQNRASSKMSGTYFMNARNLVREATLNPQLDDLVKALPLKRY